MDICVLITIFIVYLYVFSGELYVFILVYVFIVIFTPFS